MTANRNQVLLALAALLAGCAGGYAVAQLTSAPERARGALAPERAARVELDEAALAAALVRGIDERFGALLSQLAGAPATRALPSARREPADADRGQTGDGAEQERLTAALAGVERALSRGDRGSAGAAAGRWRVAAGSDPLGLDAFGSRELRTALVDGEDWAYDSWGAGLRERLLLATPAEVVAWLGWPQDTGMEGGYAYWGYRIQDRDVEWSRGTLLHNVTVYFQGGAVMSVDADYDVAD